MKGMFNLLKLSEYLQLYGNKKAAIVGAGAVGTYIAEFLAKLGLKHVTLIDFDRFTLENAAKHAGLIRTPDDVDKNKALVTAERIRPLMIDGGCANGIDANLTHFGPMAFSAYDVVFIAVDNYAAKMYFNKIWKQIPKSTRPLLIVAGTYEETAQSVCLDGSGVCLRCLVDESWLTDSTASTSCTGVQTREYDGVPEIVRTSNLASCRAALMAVEEYRKYVLGDKSVCNKRKNHLPATENPYMVSNPMYRRTCPDCSVAPPSETVPLDGDVTSMTLRKLFAKLTAYFGNENYTVHTHVMHYGGVSYGGIITEEYCRTCGAHMPHVNRHESRTYERDLVCESCRESSNKPKYDTDRPRGKSVHALSPSHCDESLLDKTLFDLGWPIGAYIIAECRGDALDALDDGVSYTCFCAVGDTQKVFENMILTEVKE